MELQTKRFAEAKNGGGKITDLALQLALLEEITAQS
jgi:hypothetical protein